LEKTCSHTKLVVKRCRVRTVLCVEVHIEAPVS